MEPAHHVHGNDGREVPPVFPALQAGEVQAVLAAWPQLQGPIEILWRSPRPLSAAALLRTPGGTFFLKRHHGRVRSPATLAEEHRFMNHLRAAGQVLPAVLPTADGGSSAVAGPWVYELHGVLRGEDRFRDLPSWVPPPGTAWAHAAGRALAALHQAAHGYKAAQRSTHMLVTRDDLLRADDVLASLQHMLHERPGLAAALRQRDWQQAVQDVIVPWQQRVQPRLLAQPRLWTHNDWHVSNLAWSGGARAPQVASVFDFGLASPTCALFDLATAIERNAIAWLELPTSPQIGRPQIARALLDGYHELSPLNPEQRKLVADLLPVVHLDFALSELEYFHAITGSARDADAAWHDFLLGHARWFASPHGAALRAQVVG